MVTSRRLIEVLRGCLSEWDRGFESGLLQRGVCKNAAKRLDTGKLSSGSKEDQNILICVKQVALRRQGKRVYPPVVALTLPSGKAVASGSMQHGVPMRDLVADWKKWSRA